MLSFLGGAIKAIFGTLLSWLGSLIVGYIMGRRSHRRKDAEEALERAKRAGEIDREIEMATDEELRKRAEKWTRPQ